MSVGPAILAQRFGYGLRPDRTDSLGASLGGPDPALALFPGQTGAEALALRNQMLERVIAGRQISQSEVQQARKQNQAELAELYRLGLKRALARAVDSPDPYRERLVRFWADHFTILIRDPPDQPRLAPYVDEAIRPHVNARFGTMLHDAILHPMMLVYLDQTKSVGPNSSFGKRRKRGLNENLARELLELHTIGVDSDYSQEDVREIAKILTGLVVSQQGELSFHADRAEPGAETALGQSYGGAKPRMADIESLLADLAVHPATARHIAGKLAVHFVADTPPQPLVEDLTRIWQETGGDLAQINAALLTHPAAQGTQLEKARQPFDFIVAALRALGLSGAEILAWDNRILKFAASDPLRQMAQPWQNPIGPDGWEEDLARWITPQALARRISWAMRLPARLRDPLPDARQLLTTILPAAAPELTRIIAAAETNPEGIGLVLASPQFNRR